MQSQHLLFSLLFAERMGRDGGGTRRKGQRGEGGGEPGASLVTG